MVGEVGKIDTKIFSEVPNELKTIEIDVEKKIFNVNGVPFGDRFSGFSISCKSGDGFKIEMDIDTVVNFASYDMAGRKTNEGLCFSQLAGLSYFWGEEVL